RRGQAVFSSEMAEPLSPAIGAMRRLAPEAVTRGAAGVDVESILAQLAGPRASGAAPRDGRPAPSSAGLGARPGAAPRAATPAAPRGPAPGGGRCAAESAPPPPSVGVGVAGGAEGSSWGPGPGRSAVESAAPQPAPIPSDQALSAQRPALERSDDAL